MKKLLFLLMILLTQSAFADFADEIAKGIFQKKVNQLHKSALACSPLETDPKSEMDVNDWMKIQPALPKWQYLADIEKTAYEAKKYAKSISKNDKVQHCLAGCFIAKKLDFTSGVLVGWLKELSDASDCSNKTNFEKEDYEATILGAKLGSSEKQCDELCKK